MVVIGDGIREWLADGVDIAEVVVLGEQAAGAGFGGWMRTAANRAALVEEGLCFMPTE